MFFIKASPLVLLIGFTCNLCGKPRAGNILCVIASVMMLGGY